MVDIHKAAKQEEVVFTELHVDSFTVSQPRVNNPTRTVSLQVGSYGIDSNGNRVYAPEVYDATINDFNRVLFEDYCIKHQKTPDQAFMALLAARAKLSADFQSKDIDELYLMAAFELAVRKVVEMSGAFDLTDIN